MIINNLMTLSQFVKLKRNLDGAIVDLRMFHNDIIKYDGFLRQPSTKDLFINEIEKPKCYNDWLKGDYPTPELMTKCKKYQEAESKVIFKGWNLEKNEYKYKQFGVVFFNDGYIGLYDNLTKHNFRTQTLSNLAESTNGELQIHLEL